MNTEKLKKLLQNKALRVILVCLFAMALLIAVWHVFFGKSDKTASGYLPTEREERLGNLLEEIAGVTEATVMIGEENNTAVSAVVIIRGDLGLVTRIRVLDATASALNIPRQSILVYPADQ